MYYEFIQANKRRIVIGLAAFFVVVSVWMTVDYISHIGKLPVVISAVPSDAKIMFDDKKLGNGTQWLVPGKYTVKVSKDGFQPISETVVVTEKKQQNVVAASLMPQSDEAKRWATDHEDDYKKNEQYGSIEASSNGDYFALINPITKQLPFTDPYFKIGYIENKDQSITLTIDTPSPRYRFYAVERIRQMGYDPTDFEITFKDFHNPLEKK